MGESVRSHPPADGGLLTSARQDYITEGGYMVFAIRELLAVLLDAWQAGDLYGRLRAWWQVVSGEVVTE